MNIIIEVNLFRTESYFGFSKKIYKNATIKQKKILKSYCNFVSWKK